MFTLVTLDHWTETLENLEPTDAIQPGPVLFFVSFIVVSR